MAAQPPRPPSPPEDPQSDFALYGPRLVQEKLRVVKLIRALDRARIDPREVPALQESLVKLAEYDEMLTTSLEAIERLGRRGSKLGRALENLLSLGEGIRGAVSDDVPAAAARRLRDGLAEVAATEAEVWLEVEHLRARSPTAGSSPTANPGRGGHPLSRAETARVARETWSEPQRRKKQTRSKAAYEERLRLPGARATLVEWLNALPALGVAQVAYMHDVSTDESASDVPALLAARLLEPGWLDRVLSQRLGGPERELLSTALLLGPLPLGPRGDVSRSIFELPLAWDQGMPAGTGGKLRFFGLVQVGLHEGELVAVVPPPLVTLLTHALERVDPGVLRAHESAARRMEAEALADEPHDDPELELWKEADLDVTDLFVKWVPRTPHAKEAAARWFGRRPRVAEHNEDVHAMLEYHLLDFRRLPSDPALIEAHLARAKFPSPEAAAIARAAAAAPPRLFRVVGRAAGHTIRLEPLLPPGPEVVVHDRGISLTADDGVVFPARVYPAGRFTFLRMCGPAAAAEHDSAILRALRREQRAFVAAGGQDDAVAFLRARPEALAQAVYERYA